MDSKARLPELEIQLYPLQLGGRDQITPTSLCLSFPMCETVLNDSTYLIALSWGLSELILVKHLEQFLARGKTCINAQ